MLRQQQKPTNFEWLLMLIFILMNGSAYLALFEYQYVVFTFLALSYIIIKEKIEILRSILPFLLCYLLIFIMQLFTLKYVSLPSVVNNLSKYFCGAFMLIYFSDRFRYLYFDVMFWISLIGLFFWSIYMTTGFTPNIFNPGNQNGIIIWSTKIGEIRNAGPFGEPGLYAGYILMIPLLFINNILQFYRNNKMKCSVILLGLLSSMSSTGYLVFSLLLIYLILLRKNEINLKTIFLSILLIAGSISIYNKLDFLGEKMEDQLNSAIELNGEFGNTRFASLLFDMKYVKKHPLFGNGFATSTRYEDDPWLIEMSEDPEQGIGNGNGFSDMLASVGITFFIFYIYFVNKKLSNALSKKDSWFFIFIIIVLLQGQPFLNYPLFLGLPALIIRNKHYEVT